MRRILILAPELSGLDNSSHVSSALMALAVDLQQSGHHVTVLYTGESYQEDSFAACVQTYQAKGIDLVRITHYVGNQLLFSEPADQIIQGTQTQKSSYAVYRWLLKNNDWDTVISSAYKGDLYYSVLAKQQGLHFQNIRFVVTLYAPLLYLDQGNHLLPSNIERVIQYFYERTVVTGADSLICSSEALIDWLQQQGWDLPQDRRVGYKCLTQTAAAALPSVNPQATATSGRELVFLGALESRNGLNLLLSAFRFLDAKACGLTQITFIGSDSHQNSELIRQKAKHLDCTIKIINDYSRQQALDYVCQHQPLVIMPFPQANLTSSLFDCVTQGVNLLLSPQTGAGEILAQPDPALWCALNPAQMAQQIMQRLQASPVPVQLQAKLTTLTQQVHNILEQDYQARLMDNSPLPLVTVCITHFERPHLLKQAVASIQAQSYDHLEIVLVDDGSRDQATLAYLNQLQQDTHSKTPIQVIRTPNQYLGAARNMAAAHAKGEYLLFMDDDNLAHPQEVEIFVKAALNTDADVLTCLVDLSPEEDFREHRISHKIGLPIGACLTLGILTNCYGDANALIKKSFFDQLGGFTEDYGIGHEDWEFFNKAALADAKFALVPETLFWYRISEEGMLLSGDLKKNNYRNFRPFLQKFGSLAYGVSLGLGYFNELQAMDLDEMRKKQSIWYRVKSKLRHCAFKSTPKA
ncbi:glycosyltransferase [Brackiella oedipodis]|uniref:glycosyltransferase n=1 Tax=Brackiella oedipodis TaxID=124225 RepID=UPI00056F0F4E|nr:glycosyltransferase [Brackiella oedipodis]